MNTQPIEKRIKTDGLELEIVDMFLTIQGEGPFSGQRAVFIRLAGCNLKCPGCDTDYTKDRRHVGTEKLVHSLQYLTNAPTLVVITGGEPFRQNITPLADALLNAGHKVQVETNGAFPPSPNFPENVTIVCSPKTGSVNPKLALRANCYKYVLHADSVDTTDGLPMQVLDHSVKGRVYRTERLVPIYLQPTDSLNIAQNHRNTQAAVQSCLNFGHILQLQIHKLIGVE